MTFNIGVVCHPGFGGSARVAVELGAALAERGHRVHLFSRTRPLPGTALGPGVVFHGLRRGAVAADHRLDRDWSGADVTHLSALVVGVAATHGLDILHFHYAVPFARVAEEVIRGCGGGGPATVGTLHGTDVSSPPRGAEMRAVRAALHNLDAVTTVSRSHAVLAAEVYGLRAAPEVIPNFVDRTRFRPSRVRSGDRGRLPPRLVHVSNFRPVKDPAAVARVFVRVRRHLPAELWLVGDGDGMPAVGRILRRGGVDRHVRAFGLQPRVERIVGACDALLMMSRSESFCLAALEAAACGVPAVAPRVGGLPDVVVDGRTGFLVAPGDEDGAAAAVVALLADGRLRHTMGAAAAEHAGRFGREAVVARYEALYARLRHRGRADGGGPARVLADAAPRD